MKLVRNIEADYSFLKCWFSSHYAFFVLMSNKHEQAFMTRILLELATAPCIPILEQVSLKLFRTVKMFGPLYKQPLHTLIL